MAERTYNVAVVGATGLVGRTFLKVLEEYKFPVKELRLLASERSEGTTLPWSGADYTVHTLKEDSFKGIDIALFSAGASVSRVYAPIAAAAGALVVDNSSCWRMDPEIPLVVPEVNPGDIRGHGIIANPNCSTIQSIIPMKALEAAYGLKRICYTTYQATSGSGQKGKNDLIRTEAGDAPEFYPYPIAQTCIPEIDVFLENGYTKEEMKMVNETHKMLHMPLLPISATCVRVPVANSHAVSIEVDLDKTPKSLDEVRKVLADWPGLKVVDDGAKHEYPTSLLSNGNDTVFVGRIRKDLSAPNGLLLYCTADNIRKGAAANAVQIAQYVIAHDMLGK